MEENALQSTPETTTKPLKVTKQKPGSEPQQKSHRRELKFSRKLIVTGAFAFGLLTMLASVASHIELEDLTEITGKVRDLEVVNYWEDKTLYLKVEGVAGRFKYESGDPGYEELNNHVAVDKPVELLVETTSLEMDQPARIFDAKVNGEHLIEFEKIQAVHNQENQYVMLMGLAFCALGLWIWHRATRPLPTKEEIKAYESRMTELAEEHPRLFISVHIVNTIRQWGESIPKLGDLFTVFLFFWILPLYMHFIYITAYSYKTLVKTFCLSYWAVLACLPVAALTIPKFPGAEEYPILGRTGSRLFYAYLILNLTYGGALWLWGTLTYEDDDDETPETSGAKETPFGAEISSLDSPERKSA